MNVVFFDDSVEEFLLTLQPATRAKAIRTIELLERFGQTLGMPHSKKLDRELFELRVRGQQEVRIVYVFNKHAVTLVHGFIKKSDKIPLRELRLARDKLRAVDLL